MEPDRAACVIFHNMAMEWKVPLVEDGLQDMDGDIDIPLHNAADVPAGAVAARDYLVASFFG